MMTGNQLANYRATTADQAPCSMNRKFCIKCKQSKSTVDATTVPLHELSSRRVFVCKDCK